MKRIKNEQTNERTNEPPICFIFWRNCWFHSTQRNIFNQNALNSELSPGWSIVFKQIHKVTWLNGVCSFVPHLNQLYVSVYEYSLSFWMTSAKCSYSRHLFLPVLSRFVKRVLNWLLICTGKADNINAWNLIA